MYRFISMLVCIFTAAACAEYGGKTRNVEQTDTGHPYCSGSNCDKDIPPTDVKPPSNPEDEVPQDPQDPQDPGTNPGNPNDPGDDDPGPGDDDPGPGDEEDCLCTQQELDECNNTCEVEFKTCETECDDVCVTYEEHLVCLEECKDEYYTCEYYCVYDCSHPKEV